MQAVFYGVGAAVIGLIARSAARLARSTLGRDPLLWGICLLLGLVTALTARENVWLILLAGLLFRLIRAPPAWLRRAAPRRRRAASCSWSSWRASLPMPARSSSGAASRSCPFLHGGLVVERHWLTERQFIDAVAVALITPGPVVITTGFIGFLIAGFPAACVAAGATFLAGVPPDRAVRRPTSIATAR
jgi:chromate transporter